VTVESSRLSRDLGGQDVAIQADVSIAVAATATGGALADVSLAKKSGRDAWHSVRPGDDPGASRPPDGCSTSGQGFPRGAREATCLAFLHRCRRPRRRERLLGTGGLERLCTVKS
jgi:hypothetical protein